MAPSAPLPVPPPIPLNAFLGEEADLTANGRSSTPQLKLPFKSNIKKPSVLLAPSQVDSSMQNTQPTYGSFSDGGDSRKTECDLVTGANVGGNGVGVVSSDTNVNGKRRESKVKWTDSHGKDLTQVWEFEPSDTGDSDDDDDDGESSQACTCVIQ